MRTTSLLTGLFVLLSSALTIAQPTSQPGVGNLPFIQVDRNKRQVRIECQALHCESPLEFFCVVKGGSEHESVIRTSAKPSQIHAALLMLGLESGEGIKYSPATKTWAPPHGPPLSISMEYEKDGKKISVPANRLMRDLKTKKEMPALSWIFAGSRVMPDGNYAADVNGYVVSIVNFELTLIDVPRLASSSNETLEWETNLQLMPALGTPMTMVIEPVGDAQKAPATGPSGAAPSANMSDVKIDEAQIDRLRQRWEQQVRPHAQALRDAAQVQYEVLSSLRREQQRLVDEADRIQRTIDELEREYQQLSTPRPSP